MAAVHLVIVRLVPLVQVGHQGISSGIRNDETWLFTKYEYLSANFAAGPPSCLAVAPASNESSVPRTKLAGTSPRPRRESALAMHGVTRLLGIQCSILPFQSYGYGSDPCVSCVLDLQGWFVRTAPLHAWLFAGFCKEL